ncbi:hypothetical protein UMM65_04120 [Aureibaculum sp. 2210JD6-5]|uniref:hypothetical protein n=1 Tax=Aureibaculum sp. 2210JD6-5 TaxID=3103957 RepID=UPI002AAE3237|nr:hypothetical protein [Aureibaculum sp. 2210JD6-5]MDY7394415.1 hypothetical protein [Aureibaculum sp. 2210JD6-5]
MKRYITYFLSSIVITTILSCTSNVDFDQINNIEINQNFSSPFIYFNIDQNRFLNANGSSEIPTITDISVFDIFDTDYVQDNLVKANFNFEIENTFNRNFELELSFLNADNAITNSFVINVPNNSKVTHLQVFEGLDLLSLKFSQKLRVSVNLQPSSNSSMLSEDAEMKLIIKSSANLIFKVN